MLVNILNKYNKENFSRFHMPGNKSVLDFDINLSYDVTELDCTDDLYCSNGIIKNSENLISDIYGSGCSVFSTGGNTLCIQTMLYLAMPNGGTLIIGKNAHKSVINTMGILNIKPVWINYNKNNIICEEIKNAIKKYPEAKAVFITSPDYFGSMADIKKIKLICKNLIILVDNAHGSHLIFFDNHPINLGADLCADSAHKTLPVLTGGAFLHIGKKFSEINKIKYQDIKSAMQVFGSTSPSFLILVSLEKCAFWLKNNGKTEFLKLKKIVQEIKNKYSEILFKSEIQDPVRLTFDTSNIGLNNKKFIYYLEKFKIKPEFGIDTRTVLIPSPLNNLQDFEKLNLALENIINKKNNINFKISKKNNINFNFNFNSKISIHDAMFSRNKNICIKDSENKNSAQEIAKCPPGIPIIIPGEIINKQKIDILKKLKINYIKVVI